MKESSLLEIENLLHGRRIWDKLMIHLMKAARVGHLGVASRSFVVSMKITLWYKRWNVRLTALYKPWAHTDTLSYDHQTTFYHTHGHSI